MATSSSVTGEDSWQQVQDDGGDLATVNPRLRAGPRSEPLSWTADGAVPGAADRSGASTQNLAARRRRSPVRNSIEEMWPSPTARRLRTNRVSPGPRPDWSGWATIDGLQRAAASTEYSAVK